MHEGTANEQRYTFFSSILRAFVCLFCIVPRAAGGAKATSRASCGCGSAKKFLCAAAVREICIKTRFLLPCVFFFLSERKAIWASICFGRYLFVGLKRGVVPFSGIAVFSESNHLLFLYKSVPGFDSYYFFFFLAFEFK